MIVQTHVARLELPRNRVVRITTPDRDGPVYQYQPSMPWRWQCERYAQTYIERIVWAALDGEIEW